MRNHIFPSAPIIHAYGDETTSDHISLYCLAVLLPDMEPSCAKVLLNTKKTYGVDPCTRFHSRIMFHGDQRRRSPWNILDGVRTYDIIKETIHALSKTGIQCLIGVVNKRQAPKEIMCDPSGKELLAHAFISASAPLNRNLSYSHVKLWVDHDRTIINWYGMRKRADKGYVSGFIDAEGMPVGAELLPIICKKDKPSLLDVPDIFGYVCARAIRNQSKWDKTYFRDMYNVIGPTKTEFVFSNNLIGNDNISQF